jgi:hypothetical protein
MRLRSYTNRYILFDAEEAAQDRATELADALSSLDGRHVEVIGLPEGYKDPGELPQETASDIMNELGVRID